MANFRYTHTHGILKRSRLKAIYGKNEHMCRDATNKVIRTGREGKVEHGKDTLFYSYCGSQLKNKGTHCCST